jgi:DNA polymerase-3 subunit alpha
LRKDGEKAKDVLDKMKPKFISQAAAKGIRRQARKIWKTGKPLLNMPLISRTLPYVDCYQTAYLKANYPAEYGCGIV